jgi:hypothetical protein
VPKSQTVHAAAGKIRGEDFLVRVLGNQEATQLIWKRGVPMSTDTMQRGEVDEKVHELEKSQAVQAAAQSGAQATQAATQAGAQATQAAAQAGQAATTGASIAGLAAAVGAGFGGFIIGVFLGLAIARQSHHSR